MILLLLNLGGAFTYLVLASRGWRNQADSDLPITGEPFVWAAALPVFGLFSIVNVAWGMKILIRRSWDHAKLWLMTAGIWLAAIWLDFANH